MERCYVWYDFVYVDYIVLGKRNVIWVALIEFLITYMMF